MKRKVSLLVTVFVVIFSAGSASAIRPRGMPMTGVILRVDHSTRWITFAQDGGSVRQFVYSSWAKFRHDEKESPPNHLMRGMRVQIRLNNPLFGPDFVRQIVLIAQPEKWGPQHLATPPI